MNVTVHCRCAVTLRMITERALNASAYGHTVDGRRRVTLQMTTERALKASAHGPVFRRSPLCFFFRCRLGGSASSPASELYIPRWIYPDIARACCWSLAPGSNPGSGGWSYVPSLR